MLLDMWLVSDSKMIADRKKKVRPEVNQENQIMVSFLEKAIIDKRAAETPGK